ncbi:MAG: hypothetical protein ABJF01_21360 [bacterium]
MGTNVWAYRVGNFPSDAKTGWSYSIHFHGLDELIASLKAKRLERKVDTLAIVAHGDAGGLVQLDRDLTPLSIGSFISAFTDLNAYFEEGGGKLIFISCIAAIGADGDALLTGVSKLVPNTHVVGFTINGAMAQEGLPTAPGQVLDGDNFMRGMSAKLMKGRPVLTEYSVFSKWARNGYITKIPYQEQVKRLGFRCAWSTCPGHAKPTDRCVPALKGVGHARPWPG